MIKTVSLTQYPRTEEVANWLSHAVATLLSITGLILMVSFSARFGNAYHIVSSAVYGASLIALYSASTLYHFIAPGRAKVILRKFDHAMIFILIAGTYTPYTLVNLRGAWGWSIFGVVWGIAAAGFALELFISKRVPWLSISLYLGLGWLIVIATKPLMMTLESGGMLLLIVGGVLYSLGILFYVWKKLPFQHAIWHLFVMAGSLCHFFSIFLYVIPDSRV